MKQILYQFLAMLRRYSLSSALNVLGLGIAFASFYLIMVQVGYELRFNRNIEDYERIYNLQVKGIFSKENYSTNICRPFADMILGEKPQIESYGTLELGDLGMVLNKGTDSSESIEMRNARTTDGSYSVFAFNPLKGSFDELINNPDKSIAISSKMAKDFDLDLGSEVFAYDVDDFRKVVAIFEDTEIGSEVEGLESIINIGTENIDKTNNWNYSYYFKASNELSDAEMREIMDGATKAFIDFAKQQWGVSLEEAQEQMKELDFRFLPIEEKYFDENQESGGVKLQRGNWRMTMLLLSVAIAMLIIAIINFVNFFFALVPIRIRAVNTHKIFGCSRAKLIASFIAEAVGLTLLGLALAVCIVLLVQGSFVNAFFSVSTEFAKNVQLSLLVLMLAMVLSVVVGLILARYITQFPTAMTIKGSFGSSKSGKALRAVLVGVQYVATIILLIYTFFTKQQYDYMMSFDNGFKTTDVISTYLPGSLIYDVANRNAFSEELKSNTDIVDVCYASGDIVSSSRMTWGREYKDQDMYSIVIPVCANFIDFMGLDIVEGRSTLSSDEHTKAGVFVFNEAAQNAYDIEVGDNMSAINGNKADIVGIVEDFTHSHLRNAIEPMCFYIFGDEKWSMPDHLYMRLKPGASVANVSDFVKQKTEEYSTDFSSRYMEFSFFDEEIGATYKAEKQLADLFTVFAIVAILISLMGVFGLVFFETQYREQEIVIRRVHGAGIASILWMFNKRFIYIIALCFIIAAPISYFVVDNWLSNFANRVSISPLIFIAALLIVVVITVIIVTLRSYRAASVNPASLIRKNG